jgi:NADH:ubiquinone oxidoreductase subunit 6 (subunit J)
VTLDVAAFWALAVVLVGSGLAVVLSKNLFHSVLWLAAALVGTAGVFLLLNAEFLAAVQVLLYAGGVVTVVVFAIVVTERLVGERISQTSRNVAGGALAAALVLALVHRVIFNAGTIMTRPPMSGDVTQAIGQLLLTRYALPFELLGVLLLAGLLAASYFARPED